MDSNVTKEKFVPQTYLKVIASQLGTRLEDIPGEVLAGIELKRSPTGVNEVFFPWLAEQKEKAKLEKGEYPSEALVLFDELGAVKNLDEYKRTQNALKSAQEQMEYFSREQARHGKSAIDCITRLAILEGKAPLAIRDLVDAITADTWYKFSNDETKKFNSTQLTAGKCLVFITPRVIMKYYNKAEGIEQNIDMGQYRVTWSPSSYSMRVLQFKDNITNGRYYHSHISGDGSICWGNAGDRVAQSIAKGDPVPQFMALRQILQTYNEESPYAGAEYFLHLRNPEARLQNKTPEGQQGYDWLHDTDEAYGWIHADDARGRWDADDERAFDSDSDDSPMEYRYKLYGKFNAIGDRIGTDLYVRNSQGQYEMIDTSIITEFEEA